MKKSLFFLTIFAALSTPNVWAQGEAADSLGMDAADFTFTESQLDEDADVAQTISNVQGEDGYLSEVGYGFSAMRFKVRALDNQYNQTYINGLMMMDPERGMFNYSSVGGLNEATRAKEGIGFGQMASYGLSDVGGAQSINMRASQIYAGNKLTVSATNRNYVGRVIYTHGTGFNKNGWAFAGSLSYRGAPMGWGNVPGTFYNSLGYYLAAEKRIGDNHDLSLVTYGTPTERAQQGASTEEAYALANSHYYNPNWGYQGGKKRNARVVQSFDPTAILTWDWKSDDGSKKLTTSAGFHYALYSSSALGWSGDAYDPRPDYYKNLPSSIFNVYDPTKNNPTYLEENSFFMDQWQELYDFWKADKANRQINWDRMYFVNKQNGGESLYYQERRHSDQMSTGLSSTFNHSWSPTGKYAFGVQLSTTKGMHYKTMADLLGGQYFTDVDKFAANDHGINSDEAQNDLRNPNRRILVGDTFGYNYNIYVNKARVWGQVEKNLSHWYLALGGNIDGTTIEREGLMQNGCYKDYSFGKSGAAKFLGGAAKTVIAWTPNANHRLALAASVASRAPEARNAFVAPRVQNNFVNNLTNEDLYNVDFKYKFDFGKFSGQIGGYYARFMHGVEQTAYYNDQQSCFTYLTMTDVERQHYGVELLFNYQVTQNLKFYLLGTYGEAQYVNNPMAQVNPEGSDARQIRELNTFKNPITDAKEDLRVIADGMRIGGTPLTAFSLGLNYNINYWYFELSLNYYDRVHVSYSPYQRLNKTYLNAGKFYMGEGANGTAFSEDTRKTVEEEGGLLYSADGVLLASYAKAQEKFRGSVMLDGSIGKSLRLKHGRMLNINLNLTNISNNKKVKTGGYEQNRDDSYYKEEGDIYTKGEDRAYKFSKNAKYYYAFPFNFFLNVGLKF